MGHSEHPGPVMASPDLAPLSAQAAQWDGAQPFVARARYKRKRVIINTTTECCNIKLAFMVRLFDHSQPVTFPWQ